MSGSPPPVDRAAGVAAAVAARRARAEVKRAIAHGTRSAREVLERAQDPDAPAEASLRVREFLGSIPHIGPTKIERIMAELEIADAKRLGGLGRRQLDRLREWLRSRTAGADLAHLVVLAGPTAVGKGAVSTYIRDHYPEVLLSVSATTRPPRPGEVHGVNYFFVDDAEFDRLIAEGELLEWATVHNTHRYGTPRAPIREALALGRSVLLEIDIQGARQVRAVEPAARLVFLLPPSWEEMVRRLIGRGTESPEEQQRRLETAKVELAGQDEFDFAVVNDIVARAAAEVVELMKSSASVAVPSSDGGAGSSGFDASAAPTEQENHHGR